MENFLKKWLLNGYRWETIEYSGYVCLGIKISVKNQDRVLAQNKKSIVKSTENC